MQVFADMARSTLSALTSTSLTVADGGGFPTANRGTADDANGNTWFKVVLARGNDFEVCYVHTHSGDGVMANVMRAQDGTTEQSWPLDETKVFCTPLASDSTKFEAKVWEKIDFASQADAEAGADNSKAMSALRVKQSIAANVRKTIERASRTANTQLLASDSGKWIDVTAGTFTQTFLAPAALGAGWWCYIKNAGTGQITIPSSDGRTNWIMYPNEMRLFQCDGSQLRSFVLAPYSQTMTTSGSFIKPPGYRAHGGHLWSGGCSGVSYGGLSESTAPGGPGGVCEEFELLDAAIPNTVSVTIGAGGAPAQAGGGQYAGNPGGASNFGSLITAGGYVFSGTSFLGPTPNCRTADGTPAAAPVAKRLAPGSGGSATYSSTTAAAGGLSSFGGIGGNGRVYSLSIAPTDGTAPGGGGGGSAQTGSPSAGGARGELRNWGVI